MRRLILAFALCAAAAHVSDAERPNIVFIMSDDHAAHAIGAYGSRVNQTPHIDRLAREGALLTSVFATNSICTPSRATILTGKYSHLNGVPVFNRFDGSQPTVAKYLQSGGYHTGMIGKWHLGGGRDVTNAPPGRTSSRSTLHRRGAGSHQRDTIVGFVIAARSTMQRM